MPTYQRKNARLFFSLALACAAICYVLFVIAAAFKTNFLYTYDFESWCFSTAWRFVPYAALVVIAFLAGRFKRFSDRWLLVILFAVMLIHCIIFPRIYLAPFSESMWLYDFFGAILPVIIPLSAAVMLVLVPFVDGFVLRIYSFAMAIIYFFGILTQWFEDPVSANFVHLALQLLFYVALLSFSELLHDGNKLSIYAQIYDKIIFPVIKFFFPETDEEDDEEYYDPSYSDGDSGTDSEEYYSTYLTYLQTRLTAVKEQNKEVLLAADLVGKLAYDRFLDENGEFYTKDHICAQFGILSDYMKRIETDNENVTKVLVDFIDDFIASKDTAVDFYNDAAYIAKVMHIGRCDGDWLRYTRKLSAPADHESTDDSNDQVTESSEQTV